MGAEYGLVANAVETDRVFRRGAKAWMANWFSGGERATWVALSHGGRIVEKVAPLHRFDNFRCAWIPSHLQGRVADPRGTKDEMVAKAAFWNERARQERDAHPNRKLEFHESAALGGDSALEQQGCDAPHEESENS